MRPEKEIFGGNPGRTIHEPAHLWTERPEKRRTAPTVVRYPLFDKISVYRNGFTSALGVISVCFEGWNPLLIQLIVCLPALFIILTNLVFPRLCRLMKTCTLALTGTCLIRLVRGRGFLYRWYLGTAGFTFPDGPVARHEPDGPSICIERSVSPPPAAGMDTKVHAFLCHLIELSEDKRNVLLYNRPRSVHTTT